MVKHATKDEAEKEEEEAERLVRKSPKKKPPRRDKERGRIKKDDPDLDKKDEDLSMNYKDIGGSVILARWVASEHASRVATASEEEFLNTEVKNPNSEGKDNVKLKSLQKKPEGSPGRKKYEQERKKWEKAKKDDEGKSKKKKKKTKPKSKPKRPPQDDSGVSEDRMDELQEAGTDELYDLAESSDPSEQEAALKVIKERKKPLPTGFPEPSSFKGTLSGQQVSQLKEQIKNWDLMDYNTNMKSLKENWLEANMSGNDREMDYFQEVMDTYENSAGAIRSKTLRDAESPEDLMEGEEDLNEPFTDADKKGLQRKRNAWYQSAMFSPLNSVQDMLEKVEAQLNGEAQEEGGGGKNLEVQIDNDGNKKVIDHSEPDTVEEGSKKEVYLKEMQGLLQEVRDRKMFDKNSSADRFLMTVRDESESEAIKDLDPGSYDFTDDEDINNFLGKVRNLGSADIARLVKDEPIYRMYFSFDESEDPENVSITDREKSEFMDSLHEDLKVRGFYEQLRFHNDEDNNVFNKGSLLAYRDQAIKDLQNSGHSLEESKGNKKTKHRSFWGMFLDWMDDMVKDTNKKSAVEGRSVQAGIASAFKKAGLKTAQYRGLPGPLAEDDPYKPQAPKWRLPKSRRDLDLDDYMEIVKEARVWLKDSYLTHELVEKDFRMACSLALDYSIYTASDYKYNGAVGAPEYDRLLDILLRIEGKGDH